MTINKHIAEHIIHALEGGMVPENGLPYIAVGRKEEIEVFTYDMDRIAQGYSSFRIVEGAYGTGKSFMAQLIKNEALLRGFLVMDCELAPERKMCGTKKEGLQTYRTLMARLASKNSPNGYALEEILDSYVDELKKDIDGDNPTQIYGEILKKTSSLKKRIEQLPHGFDFWEAIEKYLHSCVSDDEELKSYILRWFRGEFANKTAAKKATGIQAIIDDGSWFSYLKIWAVFAKAAGYSGIYLILDELTQITRNIVNATTREHNFERLLSMYNDCYGNDAHYMGIILCGIPSSIHDPKRGIFSYEALKSRLNSSNLQGTEIMKGAPIITLSMLTPEEFTALLEKVEAMYVFLKNCDMYFSEEERISFVDYQYRRIGASTHLTPREFLRDFLTILNLKSDKQANDTMADFLYKNGGLDLTKSMIDVEEEEDMVAYEGFTL